MKIYIVSIIIIFVITIIIIFKTISLFNVDFL